MANPDAFLFFRLGDFYEMFFEDAERGAQLLGLTLTSRNRQDPAPIPMCGLPWHQRDGYVARLLRLGHKVAICDQLEDRPLQGAGAAGVTEVLTPGSVTATVPRPRANNYLAAVWPSPAARRVLADASTGEVRLSSFVEEAAGAVAARGRGTPPRFPAPAARPEATLAAAGRACSRAPIDSPARAGSRGDSCPISTPLLAAASTTACRGAAQLTRRDERCWLRGHRAHLTRSRAGKPAARWHH
jgi:hypothetical protein